jgi:F0F1-type ATP synthase assembly protein I
MKQPKTTGDIAHELAPLMNMGVELAATVCVFGLVGWFIDDRAGTKPLWFAVLLTFGIVAGMANLIRVVLKISATKRTGTSIGKQSDSIDTGNQTKNTNQEH